MKNSRDRFSGIKLSSLNAAEKESLVRLAVKQLEGKHRTGRAMTSAKETQEYLRLRLADHRHEVFGCLFLDTQHRIIAVRELFQGTIDCAAVYPRVVVEQALAANAAALILYHNHPSGIAEPSVSDEAITKRLKDALALIDVRVLDHFVVSHGECVSFADRGLL